MRPARPFYALAIACIVASLMLGGCVSSGRRLQPDVIAMIRVGATTKGDVIAGLGDPQERQATGRTEAWAYTYAKNSGFGSSSQRLELGFENDVVVSCRFETFKLDHAGRPEGNTSVPCDQARR